MRPETGRAAASELARRQHNRLNTAPAVVPFFDDPVGWIESKISAEALQLTAYQTDVFGDLEGGQKAAARGPRGLGKTTIAALAILWFADTREEAGIDWKIVVTSGSHYQIGAYLWPEVRKWAHLANLGWTTEQLHKTSITLNHGNAVSASPERHELIEGAHATQVLVVLDEAKSIKSETFHAIEGVFSNISSDDPTSQGFALAVSTPGHPSGVFYDIHSRRPGYDDWRVRHVTLEEAVAGGRVKQEWADRLARKWGTDSTWYANHVLGEFRADDEDSIIPLSWVEAAVDRWRDLEQTGHKPGPVTRHGVDIARQGKDLTMIATRHGTWFAPLNRRPRHQDTYATGSDIAEALTLSPQADAIIDADGMGAGVYDWLRNHGHNVHAFFGSPRPKEWRDTSGMLEAYNTRSAAWWNARQHLDPNNPNPIALPPDDELLGDLTAPKLVADLTGRIRVEKKSETKKRIHRSPDAGDAVVYALWDPETVHEQTSSADWEQQQQTASPVDWTARP